MRRLPGLLVDSRLDHPGIHGWTAFVLFVIVIPAFLPGLLGRRLLQELAPAAGFFGYFQAVALVGLCLMAGFYLLRTRKLVKQPPRQAHLHADDLPRLAVISCSSCGAPLPIRGW